MIVWVRKFMSCHWKNPRHLTCFLLIQPIKSTLVCLWFLLKTFSTSFSRQLKWSQRTLIKSLIYHFHLVGDIFNLNRLLWLTFLILFPNMQWFTSINCCHSIVTTWKEYSTLFGWSSSTASSSIVCSSENLVSVELCHAFWWNHFSSSRGDCNENTWNSSIHCNQQSRRRLLQEFIR